MKGEPRRRLIFAGKELADGRRPPDLEGDKRSGVREEREHEESRIAAAAVRSWSHGGGGLKSDLGWANWAD